MLFFVIVLLESNPKYSYDLALHWAEITQNLI